MEQSKSIKHNDVSYPSKFDKSWKCALLEGKTMQTSYIFCPGFVTGYWRRYRAYGPRKPFLFQFLYRAIDFPWSYPSNWSTKQIQLQHPASHCASKLLKWKNLVLWSAHYISACWWLNWTQISLKMFWTPLSSVAAAPEFLKLKLAQYEGERKHSTLWGVHLWGAWSYRHAHKHTQTCTHTHTHTFLDLKPPDSASAWIHCKC